MKSFKPIKRNGKRWLMGLLSWGLVLLLQSAGLSGFWLTIGASAGQAQKVSQEVSQAASTAEQLVTQGRSLYGQGQFADARDGWVEAQNLYAAVGDRDGVSRTLIYQAQALESLGKTREACSALIRSLDLGARRCEDVSAADLEGPFTSRIQVSALRLLGESLQLVGQPKAAQEILAQSLSAAETQNFQSEARQAELALVNAEAIELQSMDSQTVSSQIARLSEPSGVRPPNLASVDSDDDLRTIRSYAATLDDLLKRYRDLSTVKLEGNLAPRQSQANGLNLAIKGTKVLLDSLQQLQLAASSLSYQELVGTEFFERQRWLSQRLGAWTGYAAEVSPSLLGQTLSLGSDRASLYLRINLAQSFLGYERLRQDYPVNTAGLPMLASEDVIISLLTEALQLARENKDLQAEAYALGYLGEQYELQDKPDQAQDFLSSALALSQSSGATDTAYRWQWQLGRVKVTQGDEIRAFQAYEAAVNSLQKLRGDLLATNRDLQFSFRDSVEPVYREYVNLLLHPQTKEGLEEPEKQRFDRAREVLDQLQVAELDNYFREPCGVQKSPVDDIAERSESRTAVVYSIMGNEQIDLLVKLPDQEKLIYATSPVPEAQLVQVLQDFKRGIEDEVDSSISTRQVKQSAEQLYQWLFDPVAPQISNSEVETLVFVPDSRLSTMSVAALLDPITQQYLIQKYSIAIAPSIQLPAGESLVPEQLRALAAGVSLHQPVDEDLPKVKDEVQAVNEKLDGVLLFNDRFTAEQLSQVVQKHAFPIIHIATHGKFSSRPEDTYLLAWGGEKISVNQLGELLRGRGDRTETPLQLLVLSACDTATGDNRASLGIAGTAFRAGARSILATLWRADDLAAQVIVQKFYEALLEQPDGKAKALRQAQLSLIEVGASIRSWAPFTLVGDWS